MFDLILDGTIVFVLLLFAVSLESCPPSNTFSREQPPTGLVARHFIIVLVAFPWIIFGRMREGEKALRGFGTKLLSYASAFSGRPYLSEILISALISTAFLAWFAIRKLVRGRDRQTVRPIRSNGGTDASSVV
jgi:hypothetical protein